jgi:ParB family transcriptional regulator, chromosome partitioning protein
MTTKKRGLGRGLNELLGEALAQAEAAPLPGDGLGLQSLPVEKIRPGKYQPRLDMDPEKLKELSESIKAQGLVQPVIVRAIGVDQYELIAGERRWRAAQMAGLRDIPVVLRDVSDQATIAMALIENIQREDLHPLEESLALKRLIEEFDLTHQQAADAVGRSRVAVSNLLRLLELSPEVRKLLESRKLEMGHARALLALGAEQQGQLAREAVAKQYSVREIEAAVRKLLQSPVGKITTSKPRRDPNITRLETDLSERLAAPVQIESGRGKGGKLIIGFANNDILEGILARIK